MRKKTALFVVFTTLFGCAAYDFRDTEIFSVEENFSVYKSGPAWRGVTDKLGNFGELFENALKLIDDSNATLATDDDRENLTRVREINAKLSRRLDGATSWYERYLKNNSWATSDASIASDIEKREVMARPATANVLRLQLDIQISYQEIQLGITKFSAVEERLDNLRRARNLAAEAAARHTIARMRLENIFK